MRPLPRPSRTLVALFALGALLGAGVRAPAAEPAPRELSDVVVVGGGPAGMAAAIEARLAGAQKVTVVERRSPDRERTYIFNLRRGTLSNLARLGVAVRPGQTVTALKKREFVDETGARSEQRVRALAPDPAKATHRVGDLLRPGTHGVALMQTHVMERELKQAAERLGGIEIQYESPVTAVRQDASAATAVVTDAAGRTREVHGRLLVVADGANSKVRAQLGVGWNVSGKVLRIVAGVFDQPGGATLTARSVLRDAPGGGQTATGILRLGGDRKTGVLAEVPEHRQFSSQGELDEWFRDAAERVGVRGTMEGLAPRDAVVAMRRADRLAVGERIFIIGDAARTTHAFSGLGVNFALRDATRFGLLYRKLEAARTPAEAARARSWFARETSRATDRLQAYAGPLFGGLRPGALGARGPASTLAATPAQPASASRSARAPASASTLAPSTGRLISPDHTLGRQAVLGALPQAPRGGLGGAPVGLGGAARPSGPAARR